MTASVSGTHKKKYVTLKVIFHLEIMVPSTARGMLFKNYDACTVDCGFPILRDYIWDRFRKRNVMYTCLLLNFQYAQ